MISGSSSAIRRRRRIAEVISLSAMWWTVSRAVQPPSAGRASRSASVAPASAARPRPAPRDTAPPAPGVASIHVLLPPGRWRRARHASQYRGAGGELTSGRNDDIRYYPAMRDRLGPQPRSAGLVLPASAFARVRKAPWPRTVAAVVLNGVHPFELGVACEVFGLERPELGVPWYRFKVCAAEPSPLRDRGRLPAGHAPRPGRPRRRRHPGLHPLALARRAGPGAPARRGPAGPRARGPAALDLLRGVRAGGGRAAGRPPGDDPLALHRRPGPPVPDHRGPPGRALRRRRPGADLGRDGRRASTSACTWCGWITAPRSPTPSPGGWWWRPTATAARPSSSSGPVLPDAGDDALGRALGWALEHLDEPLSIEQLAATGAR